jgi:hypothetical protein
MKIFTHLLIYMTIFAFINTKVLYLPLVCRSNLRNPTIYYLQYTEGLIPQLNPYILIAQNILNKVHMQTNALGITFQVASRSANKDDVTIDCTYGNKLMKEAVQNFISRTDRESPALYSYKDILPLPGDLERFLIYSTRRSALSIKIGNEKLCVKEVVLGDNSCIFRFSHKGHIQTLDYVFPEIFMKSALVEYLKSHEFYIQKFQDVRIIKS